ncbi:hypothetical protein HLH34_18935 [Gluconacetobacter azotocaptans]|uniref:Uncharacterized protein n=1 Tax=Gluconacetobacter azotocaptans TaxID=142834 RepID=A0A7W4JW22_9PROT|nr:DUF6283 family protein [Gluconacetobacter azotocaptans]MBB2192008.1 hypothetical protein [Gluconacetobacter azotocaptans]GBQ33080.1 hypothetical protein AA13594_2538 [Gluconacetobacter azotocaptans DSM 13594]
MTWKLKRVRQCAKCPWKVSTDPHEIPHGYCETKHRELVGTIANEVGNLSTVYGRIPLRVMACHEHHPDGQEAHCVGWLMNQLGRGNNIALRLAVLDCVNVGNVVLEGAQHERFEDTLPKST